MKIRLVILLFMGIYFNVYAGKDTTKVNYVHSYMSINIGYEKSMAPPEGTYSNPFFSYGGLHLNASGFEAFKESYFGIAWMIGYDRTKVLTTNDYSYSGTNEPTSFLFSQNPTGYFQEVYSLAGLSLKIPDHTTRYTIELRVMVGPLMNIEPNTSITSNYLMAPTFTRSETITSDVNSFHAIGIALDAGICCGYKISQHWGIMANCDMLFSSMGGKTTEFDSYTNSTASHPIGISSIISFLNLSGGLVYTFGKMTPNFVY